ncbi:MAG: GatB/YqeY domain-containing protein [Candidatus Omnitrophica bacterium]|nr:GatB/YqeY domain-containing protein [Candidatus Omnitrophota bacterium]
MTMYEKIESDMKAALKQGETVKLSTLRMLIAAIRQVQIDKNLKTIGDDITLPIIQRHIKQHKDSIEQFKTGNRQDLADKELAELKILEAYMPAQISEEELSALVKSAISESAAASKADIGKVMKLVMEKAKGRCDGKSVNQLVARLLP